MQKMQAMLGGGGAQQPNVPTGFEGLNSLGPDANPSGMKFKPGDTLPNGQKMPSMSQIKQYLAAVTPITSEQYLKHPDLELDEDGGCLIMPDTGFVIRCLEEGTSEKIFVNVCSHPLVDKPEYKDMLVESESEQGLRVPMSLGNIREDYDKSKRPCKTCDVIINPEIVPDLKKETEMMTFF